MQWDDDGLGASTVPPSQFFPTDCVDQDSMLSSPGCSAETVSLTKVTVNTLESEGRGHRRGRAGSETSKESFWIGEDVSVAEAQPGTGRARKRVGHIEAGPRNVPGLLSTSVSPSQGSFHRKSSKGSNSIESSLVWGNTESSAAGQKKRKWGPSVSPINGSSQCTSSAGSNSYESSLALGNTESIAAGQKKRKWGGGYKHKGIAYLFP